MPRWQKNWRNRYVFCPPRLRPLLEQAIRTRQAGFAAQADALVARILQSAPSSADDLHVQSTVLMQMGRFQDAAMRLEHAVGAGPVTAEMLVDHGVALAELGRFAEAAASCSRAIAIRPDFAHAYFIHGDCLRELGRDKEALQSFDKALELAPDFIPVLFNRASVLAAAARTAMLASPSSPFQEMFELALADYDRLLQLQPGDAEALVGRGHVLGELSRFDEALASLDQALAGNPRHINALHNRGVILWNVERFEEALASYDRALALQPHLAVTISNRANTLQDLLRLDEAMAAHDRVIAMAPDFASGHLNRSQCLLLRGQWEEGLQGFEWRKRRPETAGHYICGGKPEWLGRENLSGTTLFVRAEQGLGDSVQFCRYLALAQARGAKVIFSVHDALKRLMQSLVPAVEILGYREEPDAFDYHIAMMSLPLAFGARNIPAAIPYLRAEPDLVQLWKERLGQQGFRIGISWRGGGVGKADIGRSFMPRHLAALARLPGVRLISLQKGAPALAQLAGLPHGMTVETLTEFDEGKDGFIDTAAVMENLDLVISSDTAVAHLAGALGRPVWVALKQVPEWRWQLQGETTPWYPTMRLFRQHVVGDWDGVFAQMESALAEKLK